MNAVGATNGFRACLGETEKADLAVLHQGGHGAYRVLDGRGWMDAVLIVQIDHLDAEALQTGLAGTDHVLRPPVGNFAAAAAEIAELGRHEDLRAAPRDGLADKRFIVPEAIHVGGVEERHPTVDGITDQVYSGPVVAGAVYVGQRHAAEADG